MGQCVLRLHTKEEEIMNAWLLFGIICGHGLGDYVFQKHKHAQLKKKKGDVGFMACSLHCFIYTMCVFTMMFIADPSFFFRANPSPGAIWIVILCSHAILDRTHLVERWMDYYMVRTWYSELSKHNGNPKTINRKGPLTYKDTDMIRYEVDNASVGDSINVSFGSMTYACADNFIHLSTMLVLFRLIGL